MTKTTSAVWVVLGFFLLMAGTGRAQELVSQEEGVSASLNLQQAVAQRLDGLQSADLAVLEKAQAECWAQAQALGARGSELRQEARAAYEEARQDSELAKEYRRQIQELEDQMDQELRALPQVKGKLEEIQQVEQEMLVELQVRTALAGLIAAKKQEAAQAE
jgi:hypothetical protein